MNPAKSVSQTRVEMSEVMTPEHANLLGKVFGGSLLALVDLAAYACASKFAGSTCVTASFDRVDFHEPIDVGELVRLVAHVSFVGRTSVEVTIEVFAENILEGTERHTNTARVTMVAIRDGKPVEVPRLRCETADEKRRFLEGRIRRELRNRTREERERIFARLSNLDENELDRLLDANNFSEILAKLTP